VLFANDDDDDGRIVGRKVGVVWKRVGLTEGSTVGSLVDGIAVLGAFVVGIAVMLECSTLSVLLRSRAAMSGDVVAAAPPPPK